MPRIRTIKPEFWSDPTMATLDFFTRLFYIGLWNFADDDGRGRANAKELNGFLFPNDDVENEQVEAALQTLAYTGRITVYSWEGQRYFQIVHWHAHQKINKPSESKIQPPVGFTEDSRNSHVGIPEASTPSRVRAGSGKAEAGSGIRKAEAEVERECEGKPDAVASASPAPPARPPFVASDFPPAPPPLDASPPALAGFFEGVNAEPPGSAVPKNGDGPGTVPESPPTLRSVTAEFLSESDLADLLNSAPSKGEPKWTPEEVRKACIILLQRLKGGARRPDKPKAYLHASILPDVRAGKEPEPPKPPPRQPPKVAIAEPVTVPEPTEPSPEQLRRAAEVQERLSRIAQKQGEWMAQQSAPE